MGEDERKNNNDAPDDPEEPDLNSALCGPKVGVHVRSPSNPIDSMYEPSRKSSQLPFDQNHLEWIYSAVHAPEESKRRAKNVLTDVEAVGIRPIINLLPIGDKLLPFYTFGRPEFSPENLEKDVPDTFKAAGFGLNWGNFHDLSHACELARKLWGKTGRKSSGTGSNLSMTTFPLLKNFGGSDCGTRHQRWKTKCALVKTQKGPSIGGSRLAGGQVVNLEVKFRPKDWKRVVDGEWYSVFHKSCFDGIAEKFCAKQATELNLVGMTLLSPLDREAGEAAAKFLAENDTVDGVIYGSTGMGEKRPEQFHLKPRAAHAKLLFRGMPEHNYRFTYILHPWKNREKRRARWLGIEEDFSKIDGFTTTVGRILIPPFHSL